MSEEESSLTSFAKNVDSLFAEKKRKSMLSKARQIILKENNNSTIKFSQNTESLQGTPKLMFQSVTGFLGYEDDSLFDGSMDTSPFIFPQCTITKRATEIVDIVTKSIYEAVESSTPDW